MGSHVDLSRSPAATAWEVAEQKYKGKTCSPFPFYLHTSTADMTKGGRRRGDIQGAHPPPGRSVTCRCPEAQPCSVHQFGVCHQSCPLVQWVSSRKAQFPVMLCVSWRPARTWILFLLTLGFWLSELPFYKASPATRKEGRATLVGFFLGGHKSGSSFELNLSTLAMVLNCRGPWE